MTAELLSLYRRTLSALDPASLVEQKLQELQPPERLDVLAVGKGAVPMAAGAARAAGVRVARGFLLTKYGHISREQRASLRSWQLREAAHPIPDEAGARATAELVEWLRQGENPLLALLSGGTSSLLVAPAAPLTLSDLGRLNSALLRSGRPIEEVNVLRKHLSEVKGGGLARHCRHPILQLTLVDICAPHLAPEDVHALVGSGPFLPDPSSVEEARALLEGLDLPPDTRGRAEEALHETPKSSLCRPHVLASHENLRREAERLLGERRLEHPLWSPTVTGDVRHVAERFARVAREASRPGVLVASGEPTVTLGSSPGRGGRCQELALHFARAVAGRPGVALLAGSSDGTDGPTDDAGALVDGETWPALCRRVGERRAEAYLAGHDSGTALSQLSGALLRTGPTGNNINDLYLLQVG